MRPDPNGTVAAAIVSEQTLAIYHDGYRRALIGKGPLEFRTAAMEVHRFAHSELPWSGLDVEKLRQTGAWTGTFWWGGPRRSGPEPEPPRPPVRESQSLFERFRCCPVDHVVRATVPADEDWVDDPLEVDVERFVIQEGELHSVRCRVVAPSRFYPRLVTGEPVVVFPYQLHDPRTVPRTSGGSLSQGLPPEAARP